MRGRQGWGVRVEGSVGESKGKCELRVCVVVEGGVEMMRKRRS